MWKLTISQKKKVEYEVEGEKKYFTSENEIEFKSAVLADLLVMVQDAERHGPEATKYQIERVVE